VLQQVDDSLRTRYGLPACSDTTDHSKVDERCKCVFAIGLQLHSDLPCRDRLAQLLVKEAVFSSESTPFANRFFKLDRDIVIDIKRCTRSLLGWYIEQNRSFAVPFKF
jgi:hypothetical protein